MTHSKAYFFYLYFGDNEEGEEFDRNLGGGIDKL